MKKYFQIVMAVFILIFPLNRVSAEEFSIPHQFSSGDMLSANILNEVFSFLQDSSRTVTQDDMLGEWRCDAIVQATLQDPGPSSGWEDVGGLIWRLENATLSFELDDGGNYIMTSSAPTPFNLTSEVATDSTYLVEANMIFFRWFVESTQLKTYFIKKVSFTRLVFIPLIASTSTPILTCDKQNLPPAGPSELAASLSGSTVSLAWTDNSDDESSFSILRKDSLTGDYVEVGTTSSDDTTYTETATDGTYWYRVLAVNANGNSIGSNVVKVSVE